MTLEELRVVISAQTEPLQQQIKTLEKQLGGLQNETNKVTSGIQGAFKKLVGGIIALGIGKKIGESIFGGIKEAMNVEAALQQIKRIMGESSNQFLKWANTQATAFNMSKGQAIKYGSIFGNLVSGFSGSTAEITKNTEDVLKASSIIASATGRTMDDVMERIRSGLLGNTESIEDLGVNVNVAMIQSTEAFKKFANGKSWDQLSFQTQQQIRLMAILEQTSKKYGDTVNQNTSTQLAQLVAQLNNVKLSLGQAFLPIVQIVLPILTSLAQHLSYIMGMFAQFTQALFGKASNTQAQVQATVKQAAAVTGLGNATEGAGKKAKKAGKEAQGALASFDEVNTLAQGSGDSEEYDGAGGVASAMPVGAMPLNFETNASDTSDKIQNMVNNLLTLLEPTRAAFDNLKASIVPLVNTIGEALKWLYDNVLVPLATWTISEALPAFLNLLSGAFSILNPILLSFRPLFMWLWNNFLKPIANWTADIFIKTINTIADCLKTIGAWMSDNMTVVENITTTVVAFIAAWKLTELLAFIQISGGIVGALTAITTAIKTGIIAKIADKAETIALTVLYAKDFVTSLISGTAALVKQAAQFIINTGLKIADTAAQIAMTAATVAWNAVAVVATTVTTALGVAIAFLTSPIGIAIAAIAAIIAIGISLYKHWDFLKAKAAEVWEGIKVKFGEFKDWLGNVFATDWSNKFGFFGNTLNSFLANVRNIFSSVEQVFGGLIDFIAGVFTGDWSRAWSGVVDIFGGIFNGIAALVKVPLNAVIGIINTAIDGINEIKIDVPDWVPRIGGKSFGGNIPKIPYLARGGIVDNPTIAMVGEAGKEAVMPLENNTGWITELAEKINARGSSSGPIELTINFGSTNIFHDIINGINRAQRQAGKTLIEV